MIPDDTTADAFSAQVRYYRRLGPQGRLQLMLELSDDARELAADGVRRRHPEFDADAVRREVMRLFNVLAPSLG